jgi:membrane-associated protease RseP (regulator of RpoE activity)
MHKLPITNIILFIITVFTTLAAGALQQGINPLEYPGSLWKGMPFSLTLLAILGAHEFGHYYMSKKHRMAVTLPYFIPAPSLIGTFGAFIRIESPITDRRTLIDIGATGPIVGMIVAIPVLIIGLFLSDLQVEVSDSGIRLGNSILFFIFSWIVYGPILENVNLVLHPVAFSGWIGLLVTCLNLLPVGQLDGGHVAYAILGPYQRIVSRSVLVILIILGVFGWKGWLVWAGLLYLMGINHPPVLYEGIPLDTSRKVIGWLTLALFILTFTPTPF